MDPEALARYACEDQGLKRLIEGEPEESEYEQDLRLQERLIPLLDQVPAREADMFVLYFVEHKRQSDIATIFKMTQAAVSYRLSRVKQRLKFLVTVPRMSDEEVEGLLTPHFDKLDRSIMLAYKRTSSQSETAATLKLTQGLVRHRLYKACKRLEQLAELEPGLRDCSKLMSMLRDNHNILVEVFLPQFQRDQQAPDDSGDW